MSPEPIVPKSVSLTFRGFELTCQQVESLVGVAPSFTATRGEPTRPGRDILFPRSSVQYSLEFPIGCRLDEMIPALLAKLGGAAHLHDVRDRVTPEFLEFDIFLPIKGSLEQEGGFLSEETLRDLVDLRATLSFGFV
jgi:hypothetical protein